MSVIVIVGHIITACYRSLCVNSTPTTGGRQGGGGGDDGGEFGGGA